MTFPFHSMSTEFFMPYLLYHESMESLNSSSIIVNLAFSHEMLLVCLYLGSLINTFHYSVFPSARPE